MTTHHACAVALFVGLLAPPGPARADAPPVVEAERRQPGGAQSPLQMERVYLEGPPAVSLFVRFGGTDPVPDAADLRAEVVLNGRSIPGSAVLAPSEGEGAVAVLFLVDTTQKMESWIPRAREGLLAYLRADAGQSAGLNRFGLGGFTSQRSDVVPFSASAAVHPEALQGLKSGSQERAQVWESCEVAVGRMGTNPIDAAGNQLPVRRYLVVLTNGQANSDDTERDRCLRAALGAQVPVVVVGPRSASRPLRALREVAERSHGLYREVRGPNDLRDALPGLRSDLAPERLRLVRFVVPAMDLLDTNNRLELALTDSRGSALGTVERLFDASEAIRARREAPARPEEAGGGLAEDGAADADAGAGAEGAGSPASPDRADADADPSDGSAGSVGEPAGSAREPEQEGSGVGWWIAALAAVGLFAVLVIAVAVRRARRLRCASCGAPLPAAGAPCGACTPPEPSGADDGGSPILAELVIREGEGKGRRIELHQETVLLGRDPERCAAVIDDEAVSRVHATLRRFPEGWKITDMSSSHGILMGGRRIDAERWSDLPDGATFRIGNIEVVFLDRSKGQRP